VDWCDQGEKDPYNPNVHQLVNYLGHQYNKGLSYNTLNIHKSAIISTLARKDEKFFQLSHSNWLKQLMKGVFNLRPTSKKPDTWDVSLILSYFRQLGPNHQLSLKQLFLKGLTLFTLVTACRVSEIASLSRAGIQKFPSGWVFQFGELKKNSSIKNTNLEINVFYYDDPLLCPLQCLDLYMQRTNEFRLVNDGLFLTNCKPYRRAKANTLSKHLKLVLKLVGVDTQKFKGHSFRSASTSKALATGLPVDQILSRATWASESVFAKFYSKNIIKGKKFSDSVLSV
jgi:integrase